MLGLGLLLLLNNGGCASRRSLHTREYAQAADSLALRNEVKAFESLRDSSEWEEELTETVAWHFAYPSHPSFKNHSTDIDSTKLSGCYVKGNTTNNSTALAPGSFPKLFEAVYPKRALGEEPAIGVLPPHGCVSVHRRRLVRRVGSAQYKKEDDSTSQRIRTQDNSFYTKRKETSKRSPGWPFSLLFITFIILIAAGTAIYLHRLLSRRY